MNFEKTNALVVNMLLYEHKVGTQATLIQSLSKTAPSTQQ